MDEETPQPLSATDWEMIQAIGRRISLHQLDAFRAQGAGCGWCRHPIRLRGVVFDNGDAGHPLLFSTAQLPDGVTLKACGNRRATRCPACAAIYRGDARHLVKAGLLGGKGIDPSVAAHPAVLLTLTAPGFGAVHRVDGRRVCHPTRSGVCPHGRPTACFERHGAGDGGVGTPLCLDCYAYDAAVLQNAMTPELWRRTTIYLTRHLAAVLGRTQVETQSLYSSRSAEWPSSNGVAWCICTLSSGSMLLMAHRHSLAPNSSPRPPSPLLGPSASSKFVG